MKILLCHERFVFRFGVDRVLIMLGKGFKELGHDVIVMGNRFDSEVAESFASRVIAVPQPGDYPGSDEFTARWLEENWSGLFPGASGPDVALVAGWPFFSSIPLLRQKCSAAIFLDYGVVPLEGYPEGARGVLEKLHALRKLYLQAANGIIAGSEFVASSQSRPDARGAARVETILCGADHMESAVWGGEMREGALTPSGAVSIANKLKDEGRPMILALGRWEPGCYKNSEGALDLIRRIRSKTPGATLLVLAGKDIAIPDELRSAVLPVGFPTDAELQELMALADAGVSVSLWEGFNLPLAEMQWLGRPALVLDVAAHPEVVIDRWYLCRDIEEMARKACEILEGNGLDAELRIAALQRFRSHFTWRRAVRDYLGSFQSLMGPGEARSFSLVIDVTNTTHDPANSGVVRVTRRLSQTLQRRSGPIFVIWDERTGQYVFPTRVEFGRLSLYNGPAAPGDDRLSRAPTERVGLSQAAAALPAGERWLLIPETRTGKALRQMVARGRERDFRVAAIFYDSIPLLRPDLCDENLHRGHGAYMQALAECDLVIPTSHFSAGCLRAFWRDHGLSGREVAVDVLPGEFGGFERAKPASGGEPEGPIRILCVSTIEPRKNHRGLIEACLCMERDHPELDWSLTLVGNRSAGRRDLAEWVEEQCSLNPRIHWLGVVDDGTLHELYEGCSFTVYASVIEGFGLPILESLWHGRPCLCYNRGVMAELAAEGGCLTTDVTDPEAFSGAIHRLATDTSLRQDLAHQAAARKIKGWDGYVDQLFDILRPKNDATRWTDILYTNCLSDNWQMTDSERLSLTGLLARHQPRCSIEVGTYRGGSLSLISQFSQMVFSIDIDPKVAGAFAHFRNVQFLTGASGRLLPLLLRELAAAVIPVDFVLLDADHSADGIRRDIGALLEYTPRAPLFVALHDSFNPACRLGMETAGWERSPYCHWVDLDFVPGRIVEHDGPSHGEQWGGLAMAYFSPARREAGLPIRKSADSLFQAAVRRA